MGLALLLTACGTGDEQARASIASPDAEEAAGPCHSRVFEGAGFTHCIADPRRHRITTALRPEDGAEPFRSLSALASARAEDPPKVAFAMNGGMYDEAGEAIGYYVENAERLHKLNRAEGYGNFHLLPNGVFYGTDGEWAVRTSDDFAANVTERPDFGTQSGPMLVIGGKLHPKIAVDGESRHIRNAVGVDAQGRAHFVISEIPVSFGKLARFYRDELDVQDALYLDGNVSALWDPSTGRSDITVPLGPLIVVEKRAKADGEKGAP